MSYTNLLYHIVYARKGRAPLITDTLRPDLHQYLGGTVRGLGGIALDINGTRDHVHVLAKLRPTISVSEFLSKLKVGLIGLGEKTNRRSVRLASSIRGIYRQRVSSGAGAKLYSQPGSASQKANIRRRIQGIATRA